MKSPMRTALWESMLGLSNHNRAGLMQRSTLDRIFDPGTSGGCPFIAPARFLARFAVCAGVCLGWLAVPLFGQAAGPRDFGDAPPPYPTLAKENGASHGVVQGFQLGKRIDGEPDGQPDQNARETTRPPPVVPATKTVSPSPEALCPGKLPPCWLWPRRRECWTRGSILKRMAAGRNPVIRYSGASR